MARSRRATRSPCRLAVGLLAAALPGALAQKCISLSGSTTCPAFNASSISTDSFLVGLYPFLAYVSSTADFDRELSQYVSQGYVQEKYQNLLGCGNVDLGNTSSYYARYTTSFLCNGIIQNSRQPCGLTGNDAMPLCAESCASLAQSEEEITSDSQLCSDPGPNYVAQLRADFTNCALPANSLSGACITGAENEPDNCGFASSLLGLCNYCRASSENATDSCCVTSQSESRCQGVTLPVFSTMSTLFTSTSSGAPTATSGGASSTSGAAAAAHGGRGLSGGAIAGIVVGSILGFLLLLALIVVGCLLIRRRRSDHDSLNQPSPQRKGMTQTPYPPTSSQGGYEVLPGGRVARMSALNTGDRFAASPDPYGGGAGSGLKAMAAGGALGAAAGAAALKREGSLNSSPRGGDDSSPHSGSGGNFSSPEGVASGQSEQLPFFKDYYSDDDIHPNDKVSCLWAYQPRAGDEFELERGDMLKVVGIWDDGWATGVRISDRAEDYDGKHKANRDSGVSNGSGIRAESPPCGEIKAFPLVCVCLPEAWKKTVEGDTSTESGSGGPPPA